MAQGGFTLEQQFINFSKFGDVKSDGKTISIQQIDRWFIQAEVINRTLSHTDTGVCFNKHKQRLIDFKTFQLFLVDLAERKNMNVKEIKDKLRSCGLPGTDKNKPPEE